MDISKLKYLSDSVAYKTKRKPRIVIDPKSISQITAGPYTGEIDLNIKIDPETWEIPEYLETYIANLNQNPNLNTEQKIIDVYLRLCKDYVYDDNVLSYLRKNDDDSFFLPDEYGRSTNSTWKEKREGHNRRNCFEISRILAKAIQTIFDGSNKSDEYEICILWDEANTHYYVGLVNDDYCLTLDLDDFEKIKDLTRIKVGLTIDGINFVSINNKSNQNNSFNRMKSAIEEYNIGKPYHSVDFIKDEISRQDEKNELFNTYRAKLPKKYQFIKDAIEILLEQQYNGHDGELQNLDSAGLFEYMKEIVDCSLGPKSRRKVWKKIENQNVYTRCLIIQDQNQINAPMFVIDVTKNNIDQIFRSISYDEITSDTSNDFGKFILGLHRDFDKDPYDGGFEK